MDPKHRSVLQRNRVTLVVDLKPSELYDGLLEKGIFTQDMIDEIKVDFQHFYQDMTTSCSWSSIWHRCSKGTRFLVLISLCSELKSVSLQNSGTRRDQARQLLCDLEKRGSQAFPCFIQCLRDAGQLPLAELLLGGEAPVQPLVPTALEDIRPVLQPLPVCMYFFLWTPAIIDNNNFECSLYCVFFFQ